MYGRRASQLLKELSCNETAQFTAFNIDMCGEVLKECNTHHLELQSLMRYNRAEVIQRLRWKVGPVFPQEIQGKLNQSEREYFKNLSAALEAYMSELDLDLTVDMVPPKDPYIWVRVLDDIGDDVVLDDQSHNLVRHSIHLLKGTEAEQYISQGLMEELSG
ncbi:probable DNA replication complex GINS protein PSF1 [Telopea speciosissima]|uniref:probable DNA replication complex GINS protein PSF1 n=1 Tax=Telopea speciosissima TaxID=54955 RepID=UPI001CC7E3CE|nr:probable DNA replication complex GINS protein PSF1 [Telopea speciosissima]